MKKHTLIPVVLGGLMGLSLSAQAQGRGPGEGGRGGASGQNIREALIKKFDKNGDGKLDEKERPTREQLQEFFRAQLGGGGAPVDAQVAVKADPVDAQVAVKADPADAQVKVARVDGQAKAVAAAVLTAKECAPLC